MAVVGIPRALLYHYYHPFWETFFKKMDLEVKVSPETNKAIINAGITSAVDEACLPVKVFYGHVLELAAQVDYLFLPRMVSVERKEYMCPKLLGLPDMLRVCLVNPPELIDTTFNFRNKNFRSTVEQVIKEIAQKVHVPFAKAQDAWRSASHVQRAFESYLASGNLPDSFRSQKTNFPVALLGHGYNIYDRYINMNLISKLQLMGAEVRTKEMVPKDEMKKLADSIPKKMFWTLGKQLIGSGLYYINHKKIKGIIFLASFGCGPDSMVGELLERWARRTNSKPFMLLTVDEHSGEAGMVTRLEAFVDMIKRRAC